MAISAYLNWAFPRKYDNGPRGVVFSCLFQNRYKRSRPRPMFTLVVHSPPDDWVSLEVGNSHHEEIWRVEGLFAFNYHQREPGSIPVLHANPITHPAATPNGVFVNCSNRKDPSRDFRFSVEVESLVNRKLESFVVVDNMSLVVHESGKKTNVYSNKLIGVIPKEATILRTQISRSNGKPLLTDRFSINPDTGRIEPHNEGE